MIKSTSRLSEASNTFKYTVLPDGTIPLFVDNQEYKVPESELKSFIISSLNCSQAPKR